MKTFSFSIIILLLIKAALFAQVSKGYNIPFKVYDSNFYPLFNRADTTFQQLLEENLNSNEYWGKLIKEKRMCIGVVDLRNLLKIKYAKINGNTMMYAASLPKIAILLAAMDAIDKGEIEESQNIKDDLRKMISRSNNVCATRMIDMLGYQKIEKVLTDSKYSLYNPNYGGGLWVGKRYAKTGERYPDPLKGLSHAATVTQVCRFYYLLVFGKLVSFERSAEMLDIMVNPEIHHKFVHTLDKIAPNAKLFRKSGTWRDWHSDSVLVWGSPNRRYILVGLIKDIRGEEILRNVVLSVEEVLQSIK